MKALSSGWTDCVLARKDGQTFDRTNHVRLLEQQTDNI